MFHYHWITSVITTALLLSLHINDYSVVAQNCLDDEYGFRSIRPSEVSTNSVPPNVTIINGNVFSTDVPHLVLLPPPSKLSYDDNQELLKVFIPGTTDTPEGVSCLLASIGQDGPVIGLSYAFLNSPDGFRNQACLDKYASTKKEDGTSKPDGKANGNSYYARCLARQHMDALYGGASEQDIWQIVDVDDSISGRLISLLDFLSEEYPSEGWDAYRDPTSMTDLHWDRIWVLGHSQGAGHASFLAKTTKLAGATLLSGPQDDCTKAGADDVCWTRGDYQTTDVRVLGHTEEADIVIILDNWRSMAIFDEEAEPVIISDGDLLNVSGIPTGRPWLTSIEPQKNAACARISRENHCSTALDNNAPLIIEQNSARDDAAEIEGNPYLYSLKVWPRLAGDDYQPPKSSATVYYASFSSGLVGIVAVWIVSFY